MALPNLMVAPNGARRKKADHPAIPVTIAEIVDEAAACYAAGADGLHAHVRDENQDHVLDAGLYRELLSELKRRTPQIQVQITTEAVGQYSPAQQRALVNDVRPQAVSVSLVEMTSELDSELSAVRSFYHEQLQAGVAVQHILYAPKEIAALRAYMDEGVIPAARPQLLFVLGRYAKNQESSAAELHPFLEVLAAQNLDADWAVCAFGEGETECLLAAHEAGGKMRVGFENSLWNADGSIARNNAERVLEIRAGVRGGKQ